MADRFGVHIIDEHGALDRAAVAAIVFSDEQALEDLNGIVHPAMQAEIQSQIDAHAGTDRIVVLDFPLLGENPRKGLAATIVVDVPYDVAVERARRSRDGRNGRHELGSRVRSRESSGWRRRRTSSTTAATWPSLEAQVDATWAETQRDRGRRAGRGSSVMSTTGTSGAGVRRYHSAWRAPRSANAASTMSQ